MNNKILISLFAAIILIFVFEGVKAINQIDDDFIVVVQEQANDIKSIDKVLSELNSFKEFLYCMNGVAVVILLPILISFTKEKS
jgi:uncharacterized membrane protein